MTGSAGRWDPAERLNERGVGSMPKPFVEKDGRWRRPGQVEVVANSPKGGLAIEHETDRVLAVRLPVDPALDAHPPGRSSTVPRSHVVSPRTRDANRDRYHRTSTPGTARSFDRAIGRRRSPRQRRAGTDVVVRARRVDRRSWLWQHRCRLMSAGRALPSAQLFAGAERAAVRDARTLPSAGRSGGR